MILLFSFCGCNNDLPVLVKTVVWLMCQEMATTQVCSITPSSWKFRYFQSKLFHPLSRLFSSRVSVGGAAPWASDRGGTNDALIKPRRGQGTRRHAGGQLPAPRAAADDLRLPERVRALLAACCTRRRLHPLIRSRGKWLGKLLGYEVTHDKSR